jgi:hypothetical protein
LGPKGPIPGLGWGREEAGEGGAGGRCGLLCRRCDGAVGETARRRACVGAREGGNALRLGMQPAGPRACRGCLQWRRGRLGRGLAGP